MTIDLHHKDMKNRISKNDQQKCVYKVNEKINCLMQLKKPFRSD